MTSSFQQRQRPITLLWVMGLSSLLRLRRSYGCAALEVRHHPAWGTKPPAITRTPRVVPGTVRTISMVGRSIAQGWARVNDPQAGPAGGAFPGGLTA